MKAVRNYCNFTIKMQCANCCHQKKEAHRAFCPKTQMLLSLSLRVSVQIMRVRTVQNLIHPFWTHSFKKVCSLITPLPMAVPPWMPCLLFWPECLPGFLSPIFYHLIAAISLIVCLKSSKIKATKPPFIMAQKKAP